MSAKTRDEEEFEEDATPPLDHPPTLYEKWVKPHSRGLCFGGIIFLVFIVSITAWNSNVTGTGNTKSISYMMYEADSCYTATIDPLTSNGAKGFVRLAYSGMNHAVIDYNVDFTNMVGIPETCNPANGVNWYVTSWGWEMGVHCLSATSPTPSISSNKHLLLTSLLPPLFFSSRHGHTFWPAGDDVVSDYLEGCASDEQDGRGGTGGHYDPALSCSPKSADADDLCLLLKRTGEQGYEYRCTPDGFAAGDMMACEMGDWTNKLGPMYPPPSDPTSLKFKRKEMYDYLAPGTTNYKAATATSKQWASLVLHCRDDTSRLVCAQFVRTEGACDSNFWDETE